MKKIIITIVAAGALMTSCSSNGNKAETKDAENVSVVKTNETTVFKKVADGSHVDWRASHLGGLKPRFGKIFYKDASFLVNDGILTNITVEMNMSTLTVESFPEGSEDIAKLTGHLTSGDFFNIKKFPTSKFELSGIENITGDYNSKVTGNLTIIGVTKSITFMANISVSDEEVSIKSEDFSVNRMDWGLIYSAEGTAGIPVNRIIANDIGFTIHTTLTK